MTVTSLYIKPFSCKAICLHALRISLFNTEESTLKKKKSQLRVTRTAQYYAVFERIEQVKVAQRKIVTFQ